MVDYKITSTGYGLILKNAFPSYYEPKLSSVAQFVYSRCRLDLEMPGNSLQEDNFTKETDILNID